MTNNQVKLATNALRTVFASRKPKPLPEGTINTPMVLVRRIYSRFQM